jgi:hypothetical protein
MTPALPGKHFTGEPGAARSCPPGSEGAGRRRTSVMMQRAALRPYLIQPRPVFFPRGPPATIWEQRLSIFLQVVAALVVALDKCGGVRRTGFREDDLDLEVIGRVLDVSFPLLGSPQKALADIPFDVELVHISLVLYLTPRDDNVGFVARPVPIHWRAGSAAVIDQDLSIPQA